MYVPIGPLLIGRGSFNQPMLMCIEPPPGCVTVSRPARQSASLLHVGQPLQDGEMFLMGSGASGEAVTRGLLVPTAVSMLPDAWRTDFEWLEETPLQSARGLNVLVPGTGNTSIFLDAVEWVLEAITRYPEATSATDRQGGFADALVAQISAITHPRAALRRDREVRMHRRLAVERARRYIAENLTDPIRLSTLCRHARTQARALEYGFQEALGMSPVAYIRMLRLHKARRVLRSAAVLERSVSEVALDCGFWHLSQFAVDYKKQFRESPSITLRRTLAQGPLASVGGAETIRP